MLTYQLFRCRGVIFNTCGIQRKQPQYKCWGITAPSMAPYIELAHANLCVGLHTRSCISKRVRDRRRKGRPRLHLIVPLCVDVEMYEASPNNAVKVRGTTTFSLALKHLSPTAFGVFRPLRFRAPSTVRVLMQ